jgi:GMP synthase-like glutamine amidotransferase
MIVYIDLEHDRLRQQDPARWEASLARRLNVKYRLEDISGEPCLIMRYTRVSPALLEAVGARAVLVSGCYTDFEHYSDADLAGLRAIYQAADWPTLGFCGGAQLMAQVYGAEVGPMGPLEPGGAIETSFGGGMKQEHGFMPVRVQAPHPWLDGLGPAPEVFQAHYWEIKAAPAGFRVLAASDLCAVQALAHERLPLFGTQFHPEAYDDAHPAGRDLLQNFFRLAGI